jgi:exodeoxyribonuclease VII large subunit
MTAPESRVSETPITLSQYCELIAEAVHGFVPAPAWVVAELGQINRHPSGHLYVTLVEQVASKLTAQIKGVIWSSNATIVDCFQEEAGQPFARGLQVLILCRPRFHPVYGLSLDILDIDPAYTLGAYARAKQLTVERLERERLLDLNGLIELPLVPQRIAIVSSPEAAGYQDFVHQLASNEAGCRFRLVLFASLVQGAAAEKEIVAALGAVAKRSSEFDAIVVLRGGGSDTDLRCFDAYDVATAIARSPLPVLTGIGHERDQTVADMVAHTRVKTPTAAAQFLIDRVIEFVARLSSSAAILGSSSRMAVADARAGLDSLARRYGLASRNATDRARSGLVRLADRLQHGAQSRVQRGRSQLAQLSVLLPARAVRQMEIAAERVGRTEQAVRLLDPGQVLRRGYSITRAAGKAVRDAGALEPGVRLHTTLHRGGLLSVVEQIEVGDDQGNGQ